MNHSIKRFYATLILVTILAISLAQIPTVYSAATVDPQEVLVFLKDVVNIDMTKYKAILIGTVSSYPPELGGLAQVAGKYTLEFEDSKLDVLFKFRNGTLCWCLIDVLKGSPHYVQPLSADIREDSKDILQRYRTFTGDAEVERIRNMLDMVDATRNATEISDNVKLEVSINSFSSSLNWKYTFNGADYSGISISFRNGSFYAFRDDRSYYTIGGTEVNVSREEAINLALKRAENFSWTIDGVEVRDFNIVKERIDTKLLTRSREPLKLYPYWLLTLPLDDLYPGLVYGIQVTIWADTSEIIDCQTLVFGGEVPFDLQPTQQVEGTAPLVDTAITAVTVATTIAVAIAIITIKKKRK
ncbi:hypothetical protein G4O51_04525 [Candidatus Bathyarchaeota archaeon A05DMB-2]|jgi:hypothetical protein|nr:hypothetical protein [Candidatus Bathyarchaeota archaeon A05DMB-2]